ncbi:hypothetical protein MmTuc01_0575 [Methanosarcina mazei Tuc01]|uniref:Uncharacterized protein n=1 Tax=Methanosarcina mazei Tuc01 TaxID=1236903 RepID=M1Q156_METMZ|nr:hypothetical protein MmTuc01_0575 [Methanosarcina mazei Tuc01]
MYLHTSFQDVITLKIRKRVTYLFSALPFSLPDVSKTLYHT